MLNEQSLYNEVMAVLQEAPLPLLLNELVDAIIQRDQLDLRVSPAALYSPYRGYTIGERLFHPSERSLQWFTVESPYTTKTFRAVFDGGEERNLMHSASAEHEFSFVAETIKELLHNLILCWKGDWSEIVPVGELFASRSAAARVPFKKLSNPGALSELAEMRVCCRERDRKVELRELCGKHNLTLHDFVPLFFAAKPPLLYGLGDQQLKIVYLCIDPRVLLQPGICFSAVNASSKTTFYDDIAQLGQLDWSILHAKYWTDPDEQVYKQKKLHRQAEAEIPVTVPMTEVKEIVVATTTARQWIEEQVSSRNLPINVRVDRKLYFDA